MQLVVTHLNPYNLKLPLFINFLLPHLTFTQNLLENTKQVLNFSLEYLMKILKGKGFSDYEQLFQKTKTALTADTELAIHNTKHPFCIALDVSLIGLDAVLFR